MDQRQAHRRRQGASDSPRPNVYTIEATDLRATRARAARPELHANAAARRRQPADGIPGGAETWRTPPVRAGVSHPATASTPPPSRAGLARKVSMDSAAPTAT